MNRSKQLILSCVAAVALLSACQGPAPKMEAVAVDAPCVVTQAGYQHIFARHCTPTPGVNQLLPQYCTNAAAAQTFCRMVQGAANQTRVVQPDNRVRYDANLGVVVGTAGEKCGRLIITSAADGTVVTEFPEFNNAPGTCN